MMNTRLSALFLSLLMLFSLVGCGGNMVNAKEKGLIRSEGKDYVMNDGDIVVFRFNV